MIIKILAKKIELPKITVNYLNGQDNNYNKI